MNKCRVLRVSLLFSLWVSPVYGVDFPAPAGATIEHVSSSSSVMGMNVSIRKFESRNDAQFVVEFYSKLWGDQAALSKLSPWQMVGTSDGDKFYNVQVQSGLMGSWGYLSISNLPKKLATGQFAKSALGYRFPKMSGSEILNSQANSDLLNESYTFLLRSRFSINANSQFYINHYLQRGWSLKEDSKGSNLKGRVIHLTKAHQTLSLTIRRMAGSTSIVANMTQGKVIGE